MAAVAATQPAWSATDLRGDISILRRAYTALHPGLYRYATQAEIAARFDRLEADVARARGLPQTYLALSRFLAGVRCGHSYANFYNQSDKIAQTLFAGRNKLPFEFRWIDGRMIVTRGRGPELRLAPGTEIVEIDGRSTSSILADLMPLVRADGGNDGKRRALLELRGADRVQTFDVFFGLMFPPKNGSFRVRTAGAAVDLPALDSTEVERAQPPRGAPDAPKWTLAFPAERTALLTMPDWVVYNTKWNWRGFLDGAFAEMASRKTSGLIVDLRGNEGGNDCGNDIMARLIDRDLPLEAYERRVRFRRTPADIDAYLDTWDPSFKTLGDAATDIGGGFYRLPVDPDPDSVDVIRPRGPRFAGKVVVLIDAQNSSAAFQFASAVKTNRLATLCGGTTGGNQRGINGGAFFFLRLPASGLEVDVPLIGTFPQTPKPDAGLAPDIAVAPTAQDIAAGRDPALETALRLAG